MPVHKLHRQLKVWLQTHGGIFAVLLSGLVFFLPYERIVTLELVFVPGGYTLRLSHVFAGLLIVGFFTAVIVNKRKINLRSWDYLLAGFLFTYLVSALLAQDLKRALFVWVFTVFVTLMAFVISQVIRREWAKYIEPFLAVTTWLVLLFGFYQYFGDSLGLSTTVTGLRDMYTRGVLGFPRIQSFGLEPLYYASFLQIPLYYYLVQYVFGGKKRPWLLLSIIAQILLTVSRGAIIASAFAIVLFISVMIFVRWKKIVWGNVLRFGGIVLASVFLSYVMILVSSQLTSLAEKSASDSGAQNRVQSTFRQTTNLDEQDDRTRNRTIALEAWKQYPVFGIGPGNFDAYAVSVFPPYLDSEGYVIVNNQPIELLAESGLVGFMVFLSFALVVFYKNVMHLVRDAKLKDPVSLVAISGLIYLVALVIQYQTFSTLYIVHIWFVIGITMAVARTSTNRKKIV